MIKANEVGVMVGVIDGHLTDEQDIPIPDIRSNKPDIFFDKSNERTYITQRVIETSIDEISFGFAVPNEIALALNIAAKAIARAKLLRPVIASNAVQSNGSLHQEDIVAVYDYIEEIQTSIVFSYRSIEAFCNAAIPDDYIYEKENHKKVIERYPKEQIERWISTTEKVSVILPELLNTECPKGEAFWSNFKNLERLRNELIHSKSSTNAIILAELFSAKLVDYVGSCHFLLEFFIKTDPTNSIFPLGFTQTEISSFVVDGIENVFAKIDKNEQK